jgi:hypothetical protein
MALLRVFFLDGSCARSALSRDQLRLLIGSALGLEAQ